jgi:uncharacterized protein (TIGR03083 family)
MPDTDETWALIHRERAEVADMLATLTPEQWAAPALCEGWSVQVTAGHILTGAEQTPARFFGHMTMNGFRFNTMMDRDARRAGALPSDEIIKRLRATTTTTDRPPAPVVTMLGEIVVHGNDIRYPLGISSGTAPEATVACLDMYQRARFPVGGKKRIEGLRLVATDVDWTCGSGPAVSGPGRSLMMTMTGRAAALDDLGGDGLPTLRSRLLRTG